MSYDTQTEQYLEKKWQEFEYGNWEEKIVVIKELTEKEFINEVTELKGELKLWWLDKEGIALGDVLTDEEGHYVLNEMDNGNPSDDGYEVKVKKVYLPNEIQ